MQIWVDADACPGAIKEILFRAAERVQICLTLVANKPLRIPSSNYIRSMQVASGSDAADDRILERIDHGDLVITADIPLAARAIEKGALALGPRGELYSRENIGERLAMRNFLDELRGAGVNTGGPPSPNRKERQAFANQLDRLLAGRGKR